MISKERIEQIGEFLNTRLIIHRNVEKDTPWTTEEKMIQELYDSYLNLLEEMKKQKEVIDSAIEYVEHRIVEDDYMLRVDTDMVQKELLDILKEVG